MSCRGEKRKDRSVKPWGWQWFVWLVEKPPFCLKVIFVTDAIYHGMNISMNNHHLGEYFGETFSEASNSRKSKLAGWLLE